MEVMSPLDSAFLRLETRDTSLHIASVAIFEGPAPAYVDLLDLLARKLGELPRYRQRIREVPLWLGRPVWVDDPSIDLRYHLRRTALPSPGGPLELRTLMARLMSQQLDRRRPLWEDWIVEGLEGGRWALVSKVHHCMVDGIAGTDLLTRLLDSEPGGNREPGGSREPGGNEVPAPVEVWRPAPEPSNARLLAAALTSLPHRPVAAARAAVDAAVHPRRTAEGGFLLARGALAWSRLAVPVEASSLSGPLGRARAWDYTRTTFEEIKAVRQAHGGTFNDVVLAAIAGGFRELLSSRGERPEDHVLRTLIPVSVRGPGGGAVDNEVSAMIADLPMAVSDPVERLAAVSAELDRLKASGEIEIAELMTAAGGWTSPLVLAVGLTGAFRMPHRHLVTVATNVPGPAVPLYALGRRLLELYPYVPIADRVRIGVAMTSYDRVLTFGITADAVSTPDIAVLTAGITEGMRALVAASGGSGVLRAGA